MEGLRIVMLGKLRSGKTTVGQLICSELKETKGIDLKPRPLAVPIYAEAKDFYARHGLVWRKNRKLLEGIGEALNNDYPNGDKIVELYRKEFNSHDNIYVEDCRRLTQANFFKNAAIPGATEASRNSPSYVHGRTVFVRVSATDETRKARCLPGEWSEGHVTDTELDNWEADFDIDNNHNDIERLKRSVKDLVELLLHD